MFSIIFSILLFTSPIAVVLLLCVKKYVKPAKEMPYRLLINGALTLFIGLTLYLAAIIVFVYLRSVGSSPGDLKPG